MQIGSAQTCRSRGTDEKALAGITPAAFGGFPLNLALVIISLEALLDDQVETRVRPKGFLDWIAQGLLSVRTQESELTSKGK